VITFLLVELGPSADGSEAWTWRIERSGITVAEAPHSHHTLADCQNDVSALITEISSGNSERIIQRLDA
jgi:hypothetical protein